MSYTPKKKDANHNKIKTALREEGYRVVDCSRYGEGFPDLVVIAPSGKVALIEVKNNDKMSEKECEFIMDLVDPAYRISFTPEQAVEIMRGVA